MYTNFAVNTLKSHTNFSCAKVRQCMSCAKVRQSAPVSNKINDLAVRQLSAPKSPYKGVALRWARSRSALPPLGIGAKLEKTKCPCADTAEARQKKRRHSGRRFEFLSSRYPGHDEQREERQPPGEIKRKVLAHIAPVSADTTSTPPASDPMKATKPSISRRARAIDLSVLMLGPPRVHALAALFRTRHSRLERGSRARRCLRACSVYRQLSRREPCLALRSTPCRLRGRERATSR